FQTLIPEYIIYDDGSTVMNASGLGGIFMFDRFSQNSDLNTLVVANNYCYAPSMRSQTRSVIVRQSKGVKVIHNTFMATLDVATSTNVEAHNNILGYPGGWMAKVDAVTTYSIDYNQYYSVGE
ncbi:MAG: hypothetical protein ACK58T_44245, partial [Phycisphaerae bacterium]